jgi:hypothetical protein
MIGVEYGALDESEFLSRRFVADPYPLLARLRETEPVRYIGTLRAWLLTRYDDVVTVISDDRFVIGYERFQANRMGPTATSEEYCRFGKEFVALSDPPRHSRLKRLFSEPFTKKRVAELRAGVESYAHECIDRYFTSSPTDLVSAYAARVPRSVLRALLDIPPSDEEMVLSWVDVFYQALEGAPMTESQLAHANEVTRAASEYFCDVVAERRVRQGDDFVSAVVVANDAEDEPLTDYQLAANLYLLYFAGFDTQKLTFGNMVRSLDKHPEARSYLVEDTSRIPDCMHELYRYNPQGLYLARTAAVDVELGGKAIKAGDTVLMSMCAAGHDPEKYPDPERLDLHRTDTADLFQRQTFGAGRHRCLGQHLAQANLPIMLKVLLERIPDFRVVVDGAVSHPTLGQHGYEALPIAWGS